MINELLRSTGVYTYNHVTLGVHTHTSNHATLHRTLCFPRVEQLIRGVWLRRLWHGVWVLSERGVVVLYCVHAGGWVAVGT